jgi:hypothetical protein
MFVIWNKRRVISETEGHSIHRPKVNEDLGEDLVSGLMRVAGLETRGDGSLLAVRRSQVYRSL